MSGNQIIKSFHYLSIFIGGLVMLILSHTTWAIERSALAISPSTCIVKKLGDACHKQLTIKWKLPAKGNYCLYKKDKKIKCWTNQQNISEPLLVNIKKTTTFSIKNEKKHILVSTKVIVNGATSPRLRRRLRADWSVFK